MNPNQEALAAFYDGLYFVVFHLTKAITALVQYDSFLYWPFVVSSVAIAALVWVLILRADNGAEPRSWRDFLRDYFGSGLWWHRSARADYRLYFANALLIPFLFGYVMFTDLQVAGAIGTALGDSATAGDPEILPPGVLSRTLFTLAIFVAYDFGRFAAHCLFHDVRFLWEFHKVHHSAEVLTPITSFRVHPVELLCIAWMTALTTGVVTLFFNWLAAGSVTFYTFLGLHVLIWAFNLIGNLRHTPVWVSYGPRLGRWLISPAHHQLHHSCEDRHFGCNRGFELAIWDRIYGTLYVPAMRPEAFRMGLGDGTEAEFHGVARMYFRPFAGAAREVANSLRRLPARLRS